MRHFRSSIPKEAKGRVTATHLTSAQKYKVEFRVNGKVVGVRIFHESGELQTETPLRDGLVHGTTYRCDYPGGGYSTEPYSRGLVHGTARQWSAEEKLLGSYTMRHGSGVDLWWCGDFGPRHPSEIRFMENGLRHGFEWWLDSDDERNVHQESHFQLGVPHGIERHWNGAGSLRRGFPQYWIRGERVTKGQYLRASIEDATLPGFREQDNRPRRDLRQEY